MSSAVSFKAGIALSTPALLTRPSTRPKCSSAAVDAALAGLIGEQIAWHRHCTRTSGRHGVQAVLATTGEDEPGAGSVEPLREPGPESRGGAGDDDDTIAHVEIGFGGDFSHSKSLLFR